MQGGSGLPQWGHGVGSKVIRTSPKRKTSLIKTFYATHTLFIFKMYRVSGHDHHGMLSLKQGNILFDSVNKNKFRKTHF